MKHCFQRCSIVTGFAGFYFSKHLSVNIRLHSSCFTASFILIWGMKHGVTEFVASPSPCWVFDGDIVCSWWSTSCFFLPIIGNLRDAQVSPGLQITEWREDRTRASVSTLLLFLPAAAHTKLVSYKGSTSSAHLALSVTPDPVHPPPLELSAPTKEYKTETCTSLMEFKKKKPFSSIKTSN